MAVIDADEVLLNGQRYRLTGPVYQQLLNQLAPKINTGDARRGTELLASSHIFSDWTGGLGIRRMLDPSQAEGRYYYSTLDTRNPYQLHLLPFSQQTFTGGGLFPSSSYRARAGTVVNNLLYVGITDGTNYRILEWGNGSQAWTIRVNTTAGAISDAVTWVIGSSAYAVFALQSGGYAYSSNGTVWGGSAPDATHPAAQYCAVWDSRLFVLDIGNTLWYTLDLLTWTKSTAVLPVPLSTTATLLVYFNASNEPTLTVVTYSGVWMYDAQADKWVATSFQYPYQYLVGLRSIAYRGDLCVPANTSVLRYTGNVIQSIGLDRDQGLADYPAAYNLRGRIRGLADGFSFLLAAVDVDDVTGYGSVPAIYAYTGSAWHLLWRASSAPVVGNNLLWMNYNSADNVPRIWWGYQDQIWYQTQPVGIINPTSVSSTSLYQYDASGGILLTPWFAGSFPELDKLLTEFRVRTEQIGAGGHVNLYYAVSNSGNEGTREDDIPFLLAGSTITTNKLTKMPVGNLAGSVFRALRLAIEIIPNTDVATTPVVRFVEFVYRYLQEPRYSYTFEVDLTADRTFNLTPEALDSAIEAAVASQPLLALSFAKQGQELGNLGTRFVAISRAGGTSGTGDDLRGRRQLTCVEY